MKTITFLNKDNLRFYFSNYFQSVWVF